MVNKKSTTSEQKSRVRVGKIRLNKETVKNLSGNEAKKIKGGQKPPVSGVNCKNGVTPYC